MGALLASELKQRIRGRRWWYLLVAWTATLSFLLLQVRGAALNTLVERPEYVGPIMFGSLMMMVMGLSALVIPSLTATSINGERDRGTLAILQATLYRPWEIALAKLGAACITATVFLGATLPLALWSFAEGGVGVGRFVATYLVLFVGVYLFAVFGLAISSIVRRSSLSATATYGLVALLTIGSPILFGLSMATAEQRLVTIKTPSGQTFESYETRLGWRWLLLAPNPFVVLADAAPSDSTEGINEPLEAIRQAVRSTRSEAQGAFFGPSNREAPPVWPVGLLMDLVVAGIGWVLVVNRLRVPTRKLAVGERVA